MYSLYSSDGLVLVLASTGGPHGTTQPSGSVTKCALSGVVRPTPFVLCLPGGSEPALKSALHSC